MKKQIVYTITALLLIFCAFPISGSAQKKSVYRGGESDKASAVCPGHPNINLKSDMGYTWRKMVKWGLVPESSAPAPAPVPLPSPAPAVTPAPVHIHIHESSSPATVREPVIIYVRDTVYITQSVYPEPDRTTVRRSGPEPETDPGQPDGYTPAIKTNLLFDAVTALNFSLEFPIKDRFSIMVEDMFPWWKWGANKNQYCFQIWEMGFEPRWWFKSNGNLKGHFLGVYAKSAKLDLQNDTKFCYQAEYWSAGLSYGYARKLGRRMQIEFSVSLGYMPITYRHYIPDSNFEHLYLDSTKTGTLKYFGPTKAAVSLVFPITFGRKN